MKILFISRAFPPVIGGIENQNYELSLWLAKISQVKTIANRFGKTFFQTFIETTFLPDRKETLKQRYGGLVQDG